MELDYSGGCVQIAKVLVIIGERRFMLGVEYDAVVRKGRDRYENIRERYGEATNREVYGRERVRLRLARYG